MLPEWRYNIAIRILHRIGSLTTLAECYFSIQMMNLLKIKTNVFDKLIACVQELLHLSPG